ncbi:MAG: alpha/beta hydrolase [Acidobacteriota bacterium]
MSSANVVCRTALLILGLFVTATAVAEDLTFDSDGVEIRYQLEGSGEPVLLIHGYSASGDMNWRLGGVVDALAESYRVILIDNRGHGRSEKPTDPDDYGVEMVEDAFRLLDHLEIDSAHWVGYSMGGMITLKALTMNPERLRTAVISGMGWTRDDPATRERFQKGEGRGSEALKACYRGFGELGVSREQLLAIQRPVHLIVGSEDGLYESSVKPLREVRPDFRLDLLEGANHVTAPIHADLSSRILDALVAGPEGTTER